MQSQIKTLFKCRQNDEVKTLNVGVIGCGRIAEHHLRFIDRSKGARVIALSDPIVGNTQRFAEQYGLERIYTSYFEMLDSTSLDVVHILTPPEFHYRQALDAIDRGIHVLLEKPCTIHPYELEDLYRRAEAKGVSLCPDFIQLLNPVFLEAAALVDSCELGDVIHLDCHLGVDLNTPELRESIGLPWRFKLPGGILHDNITHPLYLMLRWLSEPERVTVFSRSHGVLPQGLTDHLTIMLEGKGRTANIVISAVVKPAPYYIRLFCERGNILVDFDTSTVLVTHDSRLPRSIRRASENFVRSYKLFVSGICNVVRFAAGKLVPYQGLENLIPQFYDCIRNGSEVPVPKELAIAVARTEAEIFSQTAKLHLDTRKLPSTQKSITRTEKVLVTGATGYLGSVVTRKLVKEGYYVRALVRELSHTERLEELGVEAIYGDIRDSDRVADASSGMDITIHMAAALQGSRDFMLECAIKGIENVAVAAKTCNIKRVIYISSMSVYDCLTLRDGEAISEESSLEEIPELRGTYSLAKRLAEDEVLSHLQETSPSWTILRPSVIVGNGHEIFSPIGTKIKNLVLCPGSANKLVRLVHIEDVASAIVNVIRTNGTQGRIFNLSAEPLSQREYVDEFLRKSGYEDIHVIYVPYWLAKAAVGALSMLRPLGDKIPKIHNRRLASVYRSMLVNSDTLKKETEWQPRQNLLKMLLSEVQRTKLIGADTPTTAMSKAPMRKAFHER